MEKVEKSYKCLNAVAIIVFNRPDKTKELLGVLGCVKPNKLYVISDGPRINKDNDAVKVKEVRDMVAQHVNWDCEVIKIYAERNMGGPRRVPSAMNEIFKNESQLIILEDDCIPSVSFFQYCDELLERYQDDNRIGALCGYNQEFDFFGKPVDGKRNNSYLPTKFSVLWGWATWKRVWDNFAYDLDQFEQDKEKGLLNWISGDKHVQRYWDQLFGDISTGKRNHWDYKLFYALFKSRQMGLVANSSLVSNIGADGSGANYDVKDYVSLKRSHELEFPMIHPENIEADKTYDKRVSHQFYSANKVLKLLRVFRNVIRLNSWSAPGLRIKL